MPDAFDPRRIRAAYDAVAEDYEAAFGDELSGLPVDAAVLDETLERLPASKPVLDMGCGPAQVASYLADRGTDVVGVDISPGMLHVAKRRNRSVPFVCADMRALPVPAE